MLVLSRKIGESIVIGDDIRLTIVAIRGNKIRLGVVAPEYVRVHREELLSDEEAPARKEELASVG